MQKNSNSFILKDLYIELKNKISIKDVISKHSKCFGKMTDKFVCPFHNDTKPSLSVNEEKKIFNCFACGVKGDVITFISKKENITYYEAAKQLANEFGLDSLFISKQKQQDPKKELDFYILENTAKYFHLSLNNKENEKFKEYWTKRKIVDETINFFKLGCCSSLNFIDFVKDIAKQENRDVNFKNFSDLHLVKYETEMFPVFKNRIIIPIFNQWDKCVGFAGRDISGNSDIKYLNSTETEIFQKSKILFNWNNARKLKTDTIYIVEGFMDVISLHQAGIKNTVATMGTALTEHHVNMIKQNNNIKNIVLAFDNDNAGFEATLKARKLLSKDFNCFILKPFEQHGKDLDEVVVNKPEKLTGIINSFSTFTNFLIFKNKDIVLNNEIEVENLCSIIFESLYSFENKKNNDEHFTNLLNLLNANLCFEKKYDMKYIEDSFKQFCFKKREQKTETKMSSEMLEKYQDFKSRRSKMERNLLTKLLFSKYSFNFFKDKIVNKKWTWSNKLAFVVFDTMEKYYESNLNCLSIIDDNIGLKMFKNISSDNLKIYFEKLLEPNKIVSMTNEIEYIKEIKLLNNLISLCELVEKTNDFQTKQSILKNIDELQEILDISNY